MEIDQIYRQLEVAKQTQYAREAERHAAQVALPSLLSGDATWYALKRAVNNLVSCAPQDHDVLILVNDVVVLEAEFIEPHTFLFHGINQDGHRSGIVVHYTQVQARIIYRPKIGAVRVITGFSNAPSAEPPRAGVKTPETQT